MEDWFERTSFKKGEECRRNELYSGCLRKSIHEIIREVRGRKVQKKKMIINRVQSVTI